MNGTGQSCHRGPYFEVSVAVLLAVTVTVVVADWKLGHRVVPVQVLEPLGRVIDVILVPFSEEKGGAWGVDEGRGGGGARGGDFRVGSIILWQAALSNGRLQ